MDLVLVALHLALVEEGNAGVVICNYDFGHDIGCVVTVPWTKPTGRMNDIHASQIGKEKRK